MSVDGLGEASAGAYHVGSKYTSLLLPLSWAIPFWPSVSMLYHRCEILVVHAIGTTFIVSSGRDCVMQTIIARPQNGVGTEIHRSVFEIDDVLLG
mmetsp:Transcript_23136/g.48190  ORF Transcript_23136/g.48190 Transcript_23136/m.48190 type:complete len:95 (+) Transcript_23136:648-932(+)